LLGLVAVVAMSSCTAVSTTRVPTFRRQGDIFVTQESVREPYESLGLVQVTRKGVLLFGFGDPAGTDLEAAMREVEPEIRRAGADGMMNTRVQMSQYTTAGKILGAIFFFIPLPSTVLISGELVRLRGAAPQPAYPVAPASPGGPL
jgi:hypothetical protein